MPNPNLGNVNTGNPSGDRSPSPECRRRDSSPERKTQEKCSKSDIISISSGQVQFAKKQDSLWVPEKFPTLPWPFLSIGAKDAEYTDGAMVDSLTFINRITYEPFEPQNTHCKLTKTLHLDSCGNVSYSDEKVGYVSTYLYAFSTPISSFQQNSTIGGPAIRDVLTDEPDTITNALGKLDAWITNAFLLQPPTVTPVSSEKNSIYGGIRWNNFLCYNVMDKFVPYVTSILFVIGNPNSSTLPGDKHYCVFELTDPNYFPYKHYRNGITQYSTPLVRLRIFTKCFLKKASQIYTKQHMQKKCVKLIKEYGHCTFPSSGYVLALENTDAESTYTTMSVYLPNLPLAYSKDTNIPVSILYVNKTNGKPVPTNVSVQITSTGGPSGVTEWEVKASSDSYIRSEIKKPLYSDATAGLTTPFISSYTLHYYPRSYTIANETKGVGFRYGISDPNASIPHPNMYSQSFLYTNSTQMVTLNQPTLVPGIKWNATIVANNCANVAGSEYPGPILSTLFPSVDIPNISSMVILNASAESTRYQNLRNMNFAKYKTSGSAPCIREGWWVDSNVAHDVFFLSTPTTMGFQLSSVVQFNDCTFPGDRSTITVKTLYGDIDSTTGNPKNTRIQNSLQISTFQEYFPSDVTLTTSSNANSLTVFLTDVHTKAECQKFFYDAMIFGSQRITSIGMNLQYIQISIENRALIGGTEMCQNGVNTIINRCGCDDDSSSDSSDSENIVIETFEPVVLMTLSTQVYKFSTDVMNPTRTVSLDCEYVCTDVTQISGLYTPTPQTRFCFDIYGSNFVNYYVGSNFATGQLLTKRHTNDHCEEQWVPAGEKSQFLSSVQIYNEDTEIKTLPFPQNTILKLSSFSVGIFSNIYQDLGDIHAFSIHASVTPANPVSIPNIKRISLSSDIYIDTVSYPVFTKFNDTSGEYGLRIVSMLPRMGFFTENGSNVSFEYDAIRDVMNMHDSVDYDTGQSGTGLDVDIHSKIQLSCDHTIHVNQDIVYNHTYSLSNAIPMNPGNYLPGQYYNRELLYTNGHYCHARGHNFSVFSGEKLGRPGTVYPNLTHDLENDTNHGFRYATFAYESPIFSTPAVFKYINIRIVEPNMVGIVTQRREGNYFFPNAPVQTRWMYAMLVKLHIKLYGAHYRQSLSRFESGWINGFKEACSFEYNDTQFDAGGCVSVQIHENNDVEYKVQINRRYYKHIFALVRVGISRDGARLFCEQGEITFKGIKISYSDT